MSTPPGFSKSRTLVIGFGFLGISLLWALYHAYVPIFLKTRFDLSATGVGWVQALNNALTLLLLPFFGGWSDRTPPRSQRWGRRFPFIAIGTPLSAALFISIPWIAYSQTSLPVLVATLIGFSLAMAVYRSPTIALMPDLTPSNSRSQANGIINLMGGLGALLAYFGGKALYDHSPHLPFWVGAGVSILASGVLILAIREPLTAGEGAKPMAFGATLNFALRGSPELTRTLFGLFFWSMGFSAIGMFFTSYAKFHLGLPESTGGMILGIFALAFLLGAVGAGYAGAKFGRKRVLLFGLALLVALLLAILPMKDPYVISGLFAIAGLAWALVNVNALPMVIDLSPRGNDGAATGIYYLFSQAATLFAPPLAGALMDQLGYGALLIFCSTTMGIGGLIVVGAGGLLSAKNRKTQVTPA